MQLVLYKNTKYEYRRNKKQLSLGKICCTDPKKTVADLYVNEKMSERVLPKTFFYL